MTQHKVGIGWIPFTHQSLLGPGSLWFNTWVPRSGYINLESLVLWKLWVGDLCHFFSWCKWLAHHTKQNIRLIELEDEIAFLSFQGAPVGLLPCKLRGPGYPKWAPSSFAFHIWTVHSKMELWFPLSYAVGQSISQRNVSIHPCVQSCLALCDPMDYSPPGSSVHGDFPGKTTGVGCPVLLQGIPQTGIQHARPALADRPLSHPSDD